MMDGAGRGLFMSLSAMCLTWLKNVNTNQTKEQKNLFIRRNLVNTMEEATLYGETYSNFYRGT